MQRTGSEGGKHKEGAAPQIGPPWGARSGRVVSVPAPHSMPRPRSLRAKLLAAVLLYVALLGAVGLMGLYAAQASLDGLHVAVEHHVR